MGWTLILEKFWPYIVAGVVALVLLGYIGWLKVDNATLTHQNAALETQKASLTTERDEARKATIAMQAKIKEQSDAVDAAKALADAKKAASGKALAALAEKHKAAEERIKWLEGLVNQPGAASKTCTEAWGAIRNGH